MTENQYKAPEPSDPRLVRRVALFRWILLGAMVVASVAGWWIYISSTESAQHEVAKYHCPMHPQITSPTPGDCPICGMKLVPIPEDQKGHEAMPNANAGDEMQPGDKAASGLSAVMLSPERREQAAVATVAAQEKTLGRELNMPAVVEASERAVFEVRVRAPAFVERVAAVETGSKVKKGAPLAWLYSPEILRAQEELLTAERWTESANADDTQTHSLIDAQASAAARQRLELLGVDPSDVNAIMKSGTPQRLVPLRASGSGIVTERRIATGTYATPEVTLFRITDLSQLWASATVAPEDVSFIGQGTRGEFVSRDNQQKYSAEATLIEPLVSAQTRAQRVRFVVNNRDGSLLPGDIGQVSVTLPEQKYLVIPRDSVIDTGQARYVFVEITENIFTPRMVTLGPLLGEERAVLSGVAAGEKVVARGAFLVDSESRLQSALGDSVP